MSKRVLITGGAGFIGSHLCDELLAHGYEVRALDVLVPQVHGADAQRPAYLDEHVELLVGDVRDRELLTRALKNVDAVVHLVAAVGVGQSMYEIEHYTSTNNLGTAVLMELLAERGIERLLVASSMSIYGEGAYRCPVTGRLEEAGERSLLQLKEGRWELRCADGHVLEPLPTAETKAPRPSSVYALSKYDQEKMCLMVGKAYGIPTTAMRFFNVFGPRQALSNPYTGVLAIFSARCLAGRAPRIFEDGLQRRDFVNVHDVARACRFALEAGPQCSGEVFNIGSGRAVTVREVAESIACTLGCTHLEPEISREYRVGDIRHCFADISRARRLLGYEPAVAFEEGLIELAQWLQTAAPGSLNNPADAGAELARRGLVVSAGGQEAWKQPSAQPAAAGRSMSAEPTPSAAPRGEDLGTCAASDGRAGVANDGNGASRGVASGASGNGAAHNGSGGTAGATAGGRRPSQLGLVEWFRIGDRDKVARVLEDVGRLGITKLRTGISWADYHRPGGKAWYDWLLPALAEHVELLPCIMYTPPSLGIAERTSAPPRDTKMFADFIDMLLTEYGTHFGSIELWNEPTNPNHWDRTLDPDWSIFCDMIGKAAYWARHRGKQTVLGGVGTDNFDWFRVIGEQGALTHIDVLGVHVRPGTWEQDPHDLPSQLEALEAQLTRMGLRRRVWITEAAYSTWQQDEHRQLREFLRLIECPVERVYWSTIEDMDPEAAFADGWEQDERHFHFGLRRLNGAPKLLYRVLSSGGVPEASRFVRLAGRGREHLRDSGRAPRRAAGRRATVQRSKPALVMGGAGFIGTNLCARLLEDGREVMVFDNLSRPGVEQNLEWLEESYGDRVHVIVEDVRDGHAVRRAVQRASMIFHLAAQVAVTTSLVDPIEDFSINAAGTLNVLEACRRRTSPPPLLFTSTNKVYGCLEDLPLRLAGSRYEPLDARLREHGVGEERPLDFHSPYGCSKGVADQYVLDFARCYALPAVVLRMSCIYGPHQCGNEDQGWVAHFARQVIEERPITLYGDGFQVRDALYVEDLVEAMLLAMGRIRRVAGRAFNIGGGPGNAVSPHDVLERLAGLHGTLPRVQYGPWRQGDQKYYVSDTRRFQDETGWRPRVDVGRGIAELYRWLQSMPVTAAARLDAAAVAAAPT
ncbi:MAG TPA: NAD-dependent epimerase/dehydratase family protein [Candidatus Limnocylindrales bacterium]|nr:NAD-dependent epimerase/dehydratase family protein [Candidatus Limnocylindrales bacterium]